MNRHLILVNTQPFSNKPVNSFLRIVIIGFVIMSGFLFTVDNFSQSLNYSTYTISDGLPSNVITALLQDARGYIWIGTNNGLAVYNGTDFSKYSVVDGLSNNWITEIVESNNEVGTYWFGTIAGGLNKYSNGKFIHYTFGTNPDSNNISNLVLDKNGSPWFTTLFGLWTIKESHLVKINHPTIENNPNIILLNVNGNIWCSVNNKIFQYDESTSGWQSIPVNLSRSDKIISMITDEGKGVWIGTQSQKIFLIDSISIVRSANIKFGMPKLLAQNSDYLIYRDNDRIFSISKNDLSIQSRLAVSSNKEMPPDVTSPIMIDKEGNIWIGTWNKGLIKISDPSTYIVGFNESIKINSSVIDKYGHIWIGSVNGLFEVYKNENQEWEKIFHQVIQQSKKSELFINLIDSENRLWLSSDLRNVLLFELKSNKNKPSSLLKQKVPDIFNKMNSEALLTIYEDKQERLWFSFAHKGLVSLKVSDLNLLDFFGEGYYLPGNEVRVIYQDNKHQIWIGGWQEGISLFNPDRFESPLGSFNKSITTDNGLPDNMIRAISEDRSGNIWVGTRHNGLIIFNADYHNTQSITMKDGLLSNAVWKIVNGPENKIWLITDSGIEQIDEASFKVIPPRKDFLIGGLYSLINWKNKIWVFNDSEKLVIFEPSGSVKKTVYPPVEITKILVNGNTVNRKSFSNLSNTQNNLTFEFTALSFRDEKAVRYQYRLLGANENWTEPMEHHFVSFASLSPGKYTFEVRAINSEGIVSNTPASFSFIIVPPFWQRWWFILLIGIFLAVIIYLVLRSRIKRLLELEKLRLRISSDLHDDVGTNLSSILLSTQLMEKKFSLDTSEKEYLEQLRSTTSKTQELLREIVWLLNPSNDNSENLILKLKSIAAEILKDINYSFHSDENLFPEKLSIEFKRNIVLIFKESLQNIIKHSSAANVKIEMKKDKNIALIQIMDDGKGFDINKINKGNGLVNLLNRADAIKGKLDIESKEGSGTIVSLRFNTTQMRTIKKGIFKIS